MQHSNQGRKSDYYGRFRVIMIRYGKHYRWLIRIYRFKDLSSGYQFYDARLSRKKTRVFAKREVMKEIRSW